jgi:hypothetical protein
VTEPDSDGGVFELTVEGALGPVLRCALRPGRVEESHTCTTIRTVGVQNVPGLVELLDSIGLLIDGVWLVYREP